MTTPSPFTLLRASLALVLAWQFGAAQAAGRVLTVAGTASLERSGQVSAIENGTPVESGDVITVGDKSALQLRFTDESIVALRANTQLKVEAYQFERKADTDRSLLALLRGGMRTITGFIGRNSRPNYQVRTNIATVGIRGTHYNLVTCNADCTNPDGSLADNGVFGGVTDGRIAVVNQSGTQEFAQQEYFYVASAAAPAVRLLAPPPVLSDRRVVTRATATQRQAAAGANDVRSERSERRAAALMSTSPQLTNALARSPAALQAALRAAVDANDIPAVVSIISGLTTDINTVRVRGSASANSASISAVADNRTVQELKAELPQVRDTLFFNAATFSLALSKSVPVERLAGAGVYWTYVAPEAGTTGSLGTHFLWGDRPTVALPTSGTALYNYGGGTAPTDNFGRVGTLAAGRLAFDFGARQIQALDPISMSFARAGTVLAATSYTVPVGAQWGMTDTTQTLSNVTCTGCANPQGTISGSLMGVSGTAYGAAIGFHGKVQGPNGNLGHAAGAAAAFTR